MIEFFDLSQEMKILAVLLKEDFSDFGLKYAFLKGSDFKSLEEPAPYGVTRIDNLADKDQIVMVMYLEADFRSDVLGVKIGKPSPFGNAYPLILVYSDDKSKSLGIYLNAEANFYEIAFPLSIILDHFENSEIKDLFGFQWSDLRQNDSDGKYKGLKKGPLLASNIYLDLREGWYENLITKMKSTFGRISKISNEFMENAFCFTYNEETFEHLYLDKDDKKLWNEIYEKIS
jgi:hypothetical protein